MNLALMATPSFSGGGTIAPYTVAEVNNGIGKSQCGRDSWVFNTAIASGAYWELDWPAPVTIGSFYVESPLLEGTAGVWQCMEIPGRNIESADVQYWNGSTWVTVTSFSGKSGDIQIDIVPAVTTTKLRLYNVTSGTGCIGMCFANSIMFEWHVFAGVGCIPPMD
jgi:hypothetical protein